MWKSEFRQNYRTISSPQFHLSLLGSLASLWTYRHLAAKVGTSKGGGKTMANYPEELAQDTVCQSHTGHMTGLWFLPARPLRLNTSEWMDEWMNSLSTQRGWHTSKFPTPFISSETLLILSLSFLNPRTFFAVLICWTGWKDRICQHPANGRSKKQRKYLTSYFENFPTSSPNISIYFNEILNSTVCRVTSLWQQKQST